MSSTSRLDLPQADITVGGTDLRVWVADEPGERSEGLSQVDRLPGGVDGMLFVFPTPSLPTFVMKETRFPLDLWFFDPGGALIGMAEMQPCPADPCPRFPAPGEVGWALETAQGSYRFEEGEVLSTSGSG